jgi:dihydroorotase-like cyclic amidohydrolase
LVLIPAENRAFITLINAASHIPGPGTESTEGIPKGAMVLLHGGTHLVACAPDVRSLALLVSAVC